MKTILLILLSFPLILFGQKSSTKITKNEKCNWQVAFTLDEGIYEGNKLGIFLRAYLTTTTKETYVEFFEEKGGQIFGYWKRHLESAYSKKGRKTFYYKSNGDSISVFTQRKNLYLKDKGWGKIKMTKTNVTDSTIQVYRDRNAVFRRNHP